jgi:hypothetical protein
MIQYVDSSSPNIAWFAPANRIAAPIAVSPTTIAQGAQVTISRGHAPAAAGLCAPGGLSSGDPTVDMERRV